MGTTLTGTTPQDTYDSLIKVTDNGPLSGSLKKLTDGLGNDSSLSLSTTAASLSGTLAVTGDVKLGTATTGTPSTNADDLVIDKGAAESGITIMSTAAATLRFGDAANTSIGSIEYDHSGDYMRFNTSGSEKVRITSAGNVGIGTSSPTEPLHVSGDARVTNLGVNFAAQADARIFAYDNSANSSLVIQQDNASGIIAKFNGSGGATKVRIDADGLKFGSDTAAANALDDYEEGTWTPALTAGGSAPTGVTYAYNGGAYTKIGRLVSISFGFLLSSKGTGGSGVVQISGLPFTSATYGAYREPNARLIGGVFATASLASSAYGFILNNNTKIEGRVGQNVDTALDYSDITDTTYLSFNLSYYI